MSTDHMARPTGPGSRPSDQAPAGLARSGFDPSRNGLRHFPRRALLSGAMEIVDREFDFVRCILPYDYRYTGNSQQWEEAAKICHALEGPMQALGVMRVAVASGIEAATADEARSGSAEGKSPVGFAETPEPPPASVETQTEGGRT